jgi:hypothetical protein
MNLESATAPFTRTVIQGTSNSISAVSPQLFAGCFCLFDSWSDGGEATHDVVAEASATYRARYREAP